MPTWQLVVLSSPLGCWQPLRRSGTLPGYAACRMRCLPELKRSSRRVTLSLMSTRWLACSAGPASALTDMAFKEQVVCDAECLSTLDSIPMVETPSGLKYQDIKKGKGPSPPTGYQVSTHPSPTPPCAKTLAGFACTVTDSLSPGLSPLLMAGDSALHGHDAVRAGVHQLL